MVNDTINLEEKIERYLKALQKSGRGIWNGYKFESIDSVNDYDITIIMVEDGHCKCCPVPTRKYASFTLSWLMKSDEELEEFLNIKDPF